MDWMASTEAVVQFWIADFTKIFVLMGVMFYVLSYLRTYLTPARISRTLNRLPGISYPLASGFGVLSPFCSCSSIPLFLGFLGMGVSLGVTLTFLLTSPMVNLVALSILPTMVGFKVTLIYLAAGVGVAMITGMVLQFTGFERYVDRPDSDAPQEDENPDRWRVAWQRTRERMKALTPYVAAGTGIGALIHGFVPSSMLAEYATGAFAVPVAVVLGIPLYTNVLAALPIVEVLIGKGVAMPIAISFLMSATGLSVPEFIMLKKVMDIRLLVALVGVIGTAIIATGYGLYLV
jgi:uncharacterized membrane protein YraQ (UPF0718 family)